MLERKKSIFCTIFFSQRKFFNICFISKYSVLNTLSEYTYFYIWKNNTLCFVLLLFKIVRSSHQRCSVRNSVLRNFIKFTGKYLYQSFFFYKLARPETLFKKRLWHRCFLVIFAKFLRTPFLQNNSGKLLLNHQKPSLYQRPRVCSRK